MNPWRKIIDAVFTASADAAGVTALRYDALERLALLLAGWRNTQALALARRLPSFDHLGRCAGEMAPW